MIGRRFDTGCGGPIISQDIDSIFGGDVGFEYVSHGWVFAGVLTGWVCFEY